MIKQKTIKEEILIEGVGLQTGRKAKLTLKASPPLSGINFIRTDLPNRPALNIQSLDLSVPASLERRTTLGIGGFEIQTVEHLMAALSGLSIDNVVIEVDGVELPGLDGSARGYAEAILKAGVVEQDAPRQFLKIDKPAWCQDAAGFLAVFPEDAFRISYTMAYGEPALGTQFFSMVIDEELFKKEIAPARTFCLEAEVLALLARGLGKGANYENTLVMSKTGPIGNKLRFPDEPVRHKVLDLIGDLYLAGMPLKGHVIGIKSGHALNMELVRQLKTRGERNG